MRRGGEGSRCRRERWGQLWMRAGRGEERCAFLVPDRFPIDQNLAAAVSIFLGRTRSVRVRGLQQFLQTADLLSLRARLVVSQKRYPNFFRV